MPQLTFQGQRYAVYENETVLECLLRHGLDIPSSCRSGICQSCLLHAVDGSPPAQAQQGLKATQQEQGFFLACCCYPQQDMTIALPDDHDRPQITADVIGKESLNNSVIRLTLRCHDEFSYQAGQFILLHRPDGLQRSYSLASVPGIDEALELHIKRVPSGRMSNWLHDELAVGDQLTVSGPIGECYYQAGHPEQSILLVGTGSGLAPLWGIIRSALHQGHQGKMALFHGAVNREGLYLVDECRELGSRFPQLSYTPCVLEGEPAQNLAVGSVDEIAVRQQADLSGWKVYLCGDPHIVQATKRRAFLAGASLQEIFSDPFVGSEI